MRYKVIYENNRGQRVNLSERPYFLNIEPILDYQWSYSEKEKRRGNIIAGFAKDIQSVDLTLHIMDANADARDEAVDYFNNVIEADIYDGIAGRLIIGDWYTWGYIIASKNTKWQYGKPVVKKVVKLVREQENWYHVVQKANYGSEQAEELYNFIEEDIKTYEGADTNSLKSLTATINPKQSGSGDPSPDNICPISGWDSVDVTRSGKNLLPQQSDAIQPLFIPNGTQIFVSATQPTNSSSCVFNFYRADQSRIDYWTLNQSVADGRIGKNVTITEDTYYVAITNVTASNKQIELGTAATAYEPYQGQTYTTDLPETVYGGGLDVVNGVLTVDRAMVDMGTLTNWAYYNNRFDTTLSDIKGVVGWNQIYAICSALDKHPIQPNSTDYDCSFGIYNKTLFVRYNEATSVAELKTALSGVQLVYELAEPRTIQITPKQVTTLLGANNVWADSGDVTVKYWDDAGRIKTASGSVVTFSKYNSMSGVGYDYPYDYMADAQSQKRIENPNSVPCDFSITIQGYVDRPEVQIGDNVIAFDLEVPYGAFLTVDSSKKTAIMTLANGEQVNVFGARDPDYYLFERIKEGKNTVTWNGSFLWEIRMLEERSEPRWRMD